jgi:hypothetical protein
MESEVLKAIAGTGVGGLIAVFMFLLYRRDILEAKKAKAELAQACKDLAEQSSEVVVNNTRAFTMLEATNAQLARAIEASNISAARGPAHHGEK